MDLSVHGRATLIVALVTTWFLATATTADESFGRLEDANSSVTWTTRTISNGRNWTHARNAPSFTKLNLNDGVNATLSFDDNNSLRKPESDKVTFPEISVPSNGTFLKESESYNGRLPEKAGPEEVAFAEEPGPEKITNPPKPDPPIDITETVTITTNASVATNSTMFYTTSSFYLTPNLTTLTPDPPNVFMDCLHSSSAISFNFQDMDQEQENRTWLLSCPKDYYHMTIDVQAAENLTECNRLLLIGAGHQVLESDVAYLQENDTRSVYVGNDTAYVHWQWNSSLTDQSTPYFQLKCQCFQVVKDPISRIVMTTPMTAPAHESLPICIKNLDEGTVNEFLNLGPLTRTFLSTLENATSKFCPLAPDVSAHIVWPAYKHKDCSYSDHGLFCVCFNISIVLEGDSYCGGIKAPNSLTQDTLGRILTSINMNVVVLNRTLEIQLLSLPFDFGLVIIPLFAAVIFLPFLIVFWWKKDYWDEKPRIEREMKMEFPETKENNPIYGKEIRPSRAYPSDDVTFDPDYDDKNINPDMSTLSPVEEEDEEAGGLDNPAFSFEESSMPSPPLSPYNARFFEMPTPGSPEAVKAPYPQIEMEDFHQDQLNQPTTSGVQIINNFAGATRFNPSATFKKASISSATESPKGTPTQKRVAFKTPSPTLSRTSWNKDDDEDSHIYEEVNEMALDHDDEETNL